MSNSAAIDNLPASEIAIVGLACRFPGARNLDEFWRNLEQGLESISFFTDEELLASGVSPSLLSNRSYIKAKGVVADVEMFDANFFGFNPREAEILDPQHRLFLECAWEAVESAGYDCQSYDGRIGVYAGASLNTYLLNLYSNRELIESINPLQLLTASDKDFLALRVSYKMNLSGPSVTVQTACSTSLVAVHMACQSLLNGECDMALAGGASIRVPQKSGYLYQEGGVVSLDGHCRAFDQKASGTVSGDGVGVVLLKRLEDALADGDYIRAVIKGSAINNDGAMKAGFTAPSVSAQTVVIAEAQAMARVEAETISYVEAHGTGTTLGDPIEVAALTQAFRTSTQRKGYCAIGSVKTNIGHLDAAAGVAGLIKVARALEMKRLPPSLHFEQPNPKVDFANSPFYVNAALKEWQGNGLPLRAGVSSFGMGGTNVHVVLEEAPPVAASEGARPYQLLALSARTEAALEKATLNLAEHLDAHPSLNLADAAFTLQVGRKAFEHRRIVVCRDVADAQAALKAGDPARVFTRAHDSVARRAVFMFSGQGSQYVEMGFDLYRVERRFKEAIDRCSQLLKPRLGLDLRDVIYPERAKIEEATELLKQTFVAQPALFAAEYALAQMWAEWGVQPRAMIGHSIGEYVAAYLAGVFSLEDALALVAARGRLMQELPTGAMLSVSLSEDEARALLNEALSLAAVNGPSSCVISGRAEAVEELEKSLTEKGVRLRRLHTSHAFHSRMMEPILARFGEEVRRVSLSEPKLPYVSNLTGRWITAGEATDPDYWVNHLRETVRFQDGLSHLLKGFDGVLLEVGPGDALSAFARQHTDNTAARAVLCSLRHPQARQSDVAFLLATLGKLWLAGVEIDWQAFYQGEQRRRLPLPTYPFERQRYWIESQGQAAPGNISSVSETAHLSGASHPRPDLGTPYVDPRNEVEQALAEVWEGLLGIEQVGVHDDFFSLGGHSLLATQLVSQLRDSFEVDVPLYKLFEAPTIASLGAVIEEMLIERIESLTDDEAQGLLEAQS
jgi:acyl transferase domain-containing protein